MEFWRNNAIVKQQVLDLIVDDCYGILDKIVSDKSKEWARCNDVKDYDECVYHLNSEVLEELLERLGGKKCKCMK